MESPVFYRKLEDGQVQCLACCHSCVLLEGKSGVCGVRQNVEGELQLLVFGKPSAISIDPVEKKPFFHVLPGGCAFSFGTLGCNFRCSNCQNHDISQIFGKKRNLNFVRQVLSNTQKESESYSPQRLVKEAQESGCTSIAYTYNEPTTFVEYSLETMKLARKAGLKNLWVSNGFMSDTTMNQILPYLDAANIDIKSYLDEFYRANCGGRLEPVLRNCARLVKEKVWLEVTTLVIPTLSDDLDMLGNLAQFIKTDLGEFVPWHISAFSGPISWKLGHLPSTSSEFIAQVCKLGKEKGLKFVYGGNTQDWSLESTFCPYCGELLIERRGFFVKTNKLLNNGHCPGCGKIVPGIWN